MKKLFVLSVLVLSLLILPSPALAANDAECRGVLTGTFDNVVVPPGAECILSNSVVMGNIRALKNSRLRSIDNTVKGNIQGDKANLVHIFGNTIGGNVEIVKFGDPLEASAVVFGSTLQNGSIHILKGDRGGFGDFRVLGNDVQKGNIKVEDNTSDFLSFIAFNKVAEDLQVFKNSGSGIKFVASNDVGENLQCKENHPPFAGQPNAVGGNAEEQCGSTSETIPGNAAAALDATSQVSRNELQKRSK